MNGGVATWLGLAGPWAILGPREILLVGLVALALYGRVGLRHTHHARTVWSWMIPPRSRPNRRPAPRVEPVPFWSLARWTRGERLYWALVLVAAAAVVAWVVTRTLIVSTPGAGR